MPPASDPAIDLDGSRRFRLAYYAARYNLDLDLITRGSGFGYYGSVVTNVIFATFTFIFFALEGSIMAQGLKLGLHLPLWPGYAASTLIIFPLVVYGMKVLSMLQVWTTPLWLVLMVLPFVYLLVRHPDSLNTFFGALGSGLKSYSPLVAIVLPVVLPPVLAIATRGKYYLRRTSDGIDLPMYDEHGNPSGEHLGCHVCRQAYERPDMAKCETHDAHICSLCLSTDKVADHVLPVG